MRWMSLLMVATIVSQQLHMRRRICRLTLRGMGLPHERIRWHERHDG
jgi:hypothetical protein